MKLNFILKGTLIIPILGIINVLLGKLAYANFKFIFQSFLQHIIYKSPMPISYWLVLNVLSIIFAIAFVAIKRIHILKSLLSVFLNIICILMVIYYIGSTY